MSIVPLSKVTLCGLIAEKPQVLTELQRLGCLHLVSLRPLPREPETVPSAHAEEAYKALRYLLAVREKRRPVRDAPSFDMTGVVNQALDNQRRIRSTTDRRDFLTHRIEQLEPWGNFTFPELSALADWRLWFYRVPLYQVAGLRALSYPWQVIHQDHRHAYTVIMARQEPPAAALPVPRTHTGAVPLDELRRQLERVEIELDELYAERQALTRWIFLLTQNLASAEDQAALQHAAAQTLDVDGIFAVQGWAPRPALPQLADFAARQSLALFTEQPSHLESPPTLLDNPQPLAGGEDLVRFYQTPGYRSWDPSTVLFFSFSLFFAMILADAGYALVLGAVLALGWRRMGKATTGRRLRQVALTLVGCSAGYGMLAGSYFGWSPADGSPLAQVQRLDLNDFDRMLELSIVIGVLHIALANGVVAYHARPLQAKLPALGWLAVVTGGLALWLGSSTDNWPALPFAGGTLLTGGLLLVLLVSSTPPIRSHRRLLHRVLEGLIRLSQLTKIFGDVMSYIRLFALGLASSSLAITFNQLAEQVAAELPGLGLLLSLLVLVLGHGLNLVLAVVSGVVHGLRLNFIEFFAWGILEAGYPFRAFAKKAIER